jgi:hypothetical protein
MTILLFLEYACYRMKMIKYAVLLNCIYNWYCVKLVRPALYNMLLLTKNYGQEEGQQEKNRLVIHGPSFLDLDKNRYITKNKVHLNQYILSHKQSITFLPTSSTQFRVNRSVFPSCPNDFNKSFYVYILQFRFVPQKKSF